MASKVCHVSAITPADASMINLRCPTCLRYEMMLIEAAPVAVTADRRICRWGRHAAAPTTSGLTNIDTLDLPRQSVLRVPILHRHLGRNMRSAVRVGRTALVGRVVSAVRSGRRRNRVIVLMLSQRRHWTAGGRVFLGELVAATRRHCLSVHLRGLGLRSGSHVDDRVSRHASVDRRDALHGPWSEFVLPSHAVRLRAPFLLRLRCPRVHRKVIRRIDFLAMPSNNRSSWLFTYFCTRSNLVRVVRRVALWKCGRPCMRVVYVETVRPKGYAGSTGRRRRWSRGKGLPNWSCRGCSRY